MNIGSLKLNNPVFLAPMAGISDLPYRIIMKRSGAALVYSEMVSAKGLIFSGNRTLELAKSSEEERPLAIQLFGSEPDDLAKAAKLVYAEGDLIDLNLGCPVNKVVRSGSGSALLKDPARVRQIIRAVKVATDLPLTIKIRSGWDQNSVNFLEIGQIAADEGVDAITLHPRTRSQGFSGAADWNHIRQLKEELSIPVIGSGDIFSAEDAVRMLKETGCDAVMIGRGSYGNPWLIRDSIQRLQGGAPLPEPSLHDRHQTALKHMELQIRFAGEHKALFEMRKHLCWYVRGLKGAATFRSDINQAATLTAQRERLDQFFSSINIEEKI
jgi:nifR3 family TIM-barrel protein